VKLIFIPSVFNASATHFILPRLQGQRDSKPVVGPPQSIQSSRLTYDESSNSQEEDEDGEDELEYPGSEATSLVCPPSKIHSCITNVFQIVMQECILEGDIPKKWLHCQGIQFIFSILIFLL